MSNVLSTILNASSFERWALSHIRVMISVLVIPSKSNQVGCVSYVDNDALKLFQLVKKSDLGGLVVKRKDGKFCQRTLWYKTLNPAYTQKASRQEFFQRQQAT
jgi:hypothetical protein